ncbi:MAG TPA: SUMF1/EgtB/PvdO family nonheme iron enzyme [Candidatus Brocadiia bacterium]|nr:SUMF1/EgtB/PvdO family nonheme iron enzyme [Candidatus Brocadiia bacterium]
MRFLRRIGVSRFFVVAAICSITILSATQSAKAADSATLYAKKDSWAETLAASRDNYRAWMQEKLKTESVTLGNWFATAPLPVKGFSDAQFPEKGVELDAKAENGKPLWQERPELTDGTVHDLPGKDAASTYLFRRINAASAVKLRAGFGSDDGLQVWLNGEAVLTRDVPRVAAPNQDQIDLQLRQGENLLLLKIHNQTGGHAFFFSTERAAAAGELWKLLERDYPAESEWMKRDLPDRRHLAWFDADPAGKMDSEIIRRCLAATGEFGNPLLAEAAQIAEGNAPDRPVRLLKLYVRSCAFRQKIEALERVNLAAMKLAVNDLTETFGEAYPEGQRYREFIAAFEKELPDIRMALVKGDKDAHARVEELLSLQTKALLANPLLDFDKLLVVKRAESNIGLPQNWQGNCAIGKTGYDNEISVLSPVAPDGKFSTLFRPKGGDFVGDVDLHYDADKMLFSMPGGNGSILSRISRWQIWEVRADGTGLRMLTDDNELDVDNYDPCYLPDGRIIFDSTRCFQGIPCVGGGNTVANLCLMDADGKNVRQLCFDQDHDWCPTVLNNGRVMYSRWEYSDTPHYFSRLLFHMNPDGSGQMEYYGSNSFWPNSIFYARPIPNHPTKVAAIVSGHHGVARMGELVIFDPAKGRQEGDGVVQRIPGYGKKVEPVIVDQLVDGVWPKFLHPYPLSEKYFLVSCKPRPDALWGIYLVDIFDNMLLLREQPGYALLEPLPFRKTQRPPAIPDVVKPDKKDATVYLTDVYQGEGLKGVPRGTVKALRVYEFHYTYPYIGGHINIGVEGPWDVHRIHGTVPVHEDGSASFTVPANMPIAVQPLDAEGRAVQVMRSWFTAMPGEVVSCAGCHEKQNVGPPLKPTLASARPPAEITPWHGPARGFSFKRDVQPVLDKYCVGCHNGKARTDGKSVPDFTAKEKNGWGNFTPSYLELHPFVYRPGPESDYHVQVPMEFHASTSELVQMLEKGHKGVKMDAESWDRLVTWIDLNVPDHGTWGEHTKLPGNVHERRLEMRSRFANRSEDPEAIPDIKREPVAYVKPEAVKKPVAEVPKVEGWPFGADEAAQRQKAAGKESARKVELSKEISIGMTLIPAGSFIMGTPGGNDDEGPACLVRVKEPFWMSETEITCEQYANFDPDHFNGFLDQHHKDHTLPGYTAHAPKFPAIRVSWERAAAFCDWLAKKTGEGFSLPTEAQWEWACRSGSDKPLSFGGMDDSFSKNANLADASIRFLAVTGVNPQPIPFPNRHEDFVPKDARFNDKTILMAEAGKYEPNAWGLRDMHGNVAEWTASLYRPYPYDDGDGRNDRAASGRRVCRGGSWRDRPARATSAYRIPYQPWQRVYNVGFRVVCPAKQSVAAR